MSHEFRLSYRAEERLAEIFDWTFDRFGPWQAKRYTTDLIARMQSVAKGHIHLRPMSTLVESAAVADLHHFKAGAHIVVCRRLPDYLFILDILHERQHVAAALERIRTQEKD